MTPASERPRDMVAGANQAFYDAHEACDLEAVSVVWEHSDRVVCVHPGWPILRGWEIVACSMAAGGCWSLTTARR